MPKRRTFEDYLKEANEELKRGNIGLTIEQRHSRLVLRGIFPPKPDAKVNHPHQQRIAIGPANMRGLEYAKGKAKEIGGLLAQDKFSWLDYLAESTDDKPVRAIVEKFREHWFENREDTPQSRETWKGEYQTVFKHLPEDKPLTEDILREVIGRTKPNSRNRRRYVLACSALADNAGLSHNLRALMGSYGVKAINPRNLPDDGIVAMIREKIKNPQWQWVYGMLATYGLRNHEVFFTDLEDFPVAYVNRGKTQERYVWPLYPEWADRWEIQTMLLPNCTGKVNGDYGARVTRAFQREQIPFSPYHLRHCWARRAIDFGLDISLAASQMGHSVKVHTEVYHLWINRKTHEKAMNIILSSPNRPIAP